MEDHVARIGKICINKLAAKPNGKRILGRPGRTWKGSKKIKYEETGCRGLALIQLSEDWV